MTFITIKRRVISTWRGKNHFYRATTMSKDSSMATFVFGYKEDGTLKPEPLLGVQLHALSVDADIEKVQEAHTKAVKGFKSNFPEHEA